MGRDWRKESLVQCSGNSQLPVQRRENTAVFGSCSLESVRSVFESWLCLLLVIWW